MMKPQGSTSPNKARSSALKASPAASVMRALAMAAAYLRRAGGSRQAPAPEARFGGLIDLHPCGLDRAAPLLDLARDMAAQILRRLLLGCCDHRTDRFQFF